MADVINLNRARKAKARVEKSARAVENRIRFGRTKAEKAVDSAETARRTHDLDGARRDRD
jgi:hypothetical protein